VKLKPAIAASEGQQAHALDRAASGIGLDGKNSSRKVNLCAFVGILININ
jgi:hypothetical protein